MNLRVLGCHGGTSRDHRSVSFLIDGHLALDAGNLGGGLTLEEQAGLRTVLVTHPHIDHVGDLGTVCDSRTHLDLPSLLICGLEETLSALRAHYFNDVLWPDFTRIRGARENVARFDTLVPEGMHEFDGLTVHAIPVHHSIPSCGFVVTDGRSTLAYSGDTGPTDRFWSWLNDLPRLDALITETSFPDRLHDLAARSGHLTPRTLLGELEKLEHGDTPVYVYGIKPAFDAEVRNALTEVGGARLRLLEPDQGLVV